MNHAGCASHSPSLRKGHWTLADHRAGEKMFVDHAGPTVGIVDGNTGLVGLASIFVAVLSGIRSQRLNPWVSAYRSLPLANCRHYELKEGEIEPT